MNTETLNTVCENDLPQKVRNTLRANDEYEDATNLKVEINNFLWCYLPMKTNLQDAEILACKIFTLIQEQIDK